MKRIMLLIASALLAANAHAGIAVVVNPAAADLTSDQVAAIYLGKDKSFSPLDLPASDAIRADFYQKATGRSLSQVKATWSRLMFSGKAQPPEELPDAASVKQAVAGDAKAIGYIDAAAVDGSVKVVLTLD
ncbi:hypothetical protein [Parahaliea aestuarii]|uniref:Phosphate ABC transporter substrate-binding protein n=1 Tax=Parahaliea aestuarii TaxID=1852021 RepID=A0A5C8ZL41_9GAMM|nr:hypothetical protein [Parahaliea aestuarii]TXS89168.1 hypothetical protein FVW59_18775 [Parahaliea aestuarii]